MWGGFFASNVGKTGRPKYSINVLLTVASVLVKRLEMGTPSATEIATHSLYAILDRVWRGRWNFIVQTPPALGNASFALSCKRAEPRLVLFMLCGSPGCLESDRDGWTLVMMMWKRVYYCWVY